MKNLSKLSFLEQKDLHKKNNQELISFRKVTFCRRATDFMIEDIVEDSTHLREYGYEKQEIRASNIG